MSEWSYSDEELDQYFQDRSARKGTSSEGGPSGDEDGAGRPTTGLRGFIHQRIADPMRAQAVVALSVTVRLLLIGILSLGTYIWTLTDDIPSTESLEDPTVQLATIAYTADGEELARYARQNRSSVSYDSISTRVIDALVATEDQRFYEHWGVERLLALLPSRTRHGRLAHKIDVLRPQVSENERTF